MKPVDVLSIAAHPDDSELLCGGTLARAVSQGKTAGIISLSRGERGTKGSKDLREKESAAAGAVLGLSVRESLDLPDGGIVNSAESRARLVSLIRQLRPQVVITHWNEGRHPDHRVAAELVRDACFLAGLKNFGSGDEPHRPFKLLHALSYREDNVKPTFVVDITDTFERKLEAVKCYGSQFDGALRAGEIQPNGDSLYDLIRHHAAHYGSLIRTRYGEPFHTPETMRVDDVTILDVATF